MHKSDLAWMKYGKCHGKTELSTLFYVEGFPFLALSICKGCPVIDECLEFAIAHKEQGVWGGTSYAERKRISANSRLMRVPVTTLRREINRVKPQSAKLVDSEQHNKPHELEHPASVSHLRLSCRPFRPKDIPLCAGKVAVLRSPFRAICKVS